MSNEKIKQKIEIRKELTTTVSLSDLKLITELEEILFDEGYMDAMYEIKNLFEIETRGLTHHQMIRHIYTSIENHLIDEAGIDFVKTSWEGVSDCEECGAQTKEEE